MLLGKVGNKSIAFINHKPFHPGNLQNLEKVWLAEQKAAENEKKQKEMLERRKHEVQIEELRKALREKERQQSAALMRSIATTMAERSAQAGDDAAQSSKRESRPATTSRRAKRHRKAEDVPAFTTVPSSKYKEDVLVNKHTAVWGSYYSRETQTWGYACCRSTDIKSICGGSGVEAAD